MPEGDTVLRTARRLHQALAGRELLAADLRWPGLSEASLAGMTVTEVVARGKHLLLRLDSGWTLHSHLRMEGQWRIEATPGTTAVRTGARDSPTWPRALPDRPTGVDTSTMAEPDEATHGSIPEGRTSADPTTMADPPTMAEPVEAIQSNFRRRPTPVRFPGVREQDVRAVLVTRDWTALGLRLGMLDLVRTAAEADVVGHLGPDLLDPGFDAALASANLAAATGGISSALLDQRNLAGLGTMWTSETLFLEHLNPGRPVAELDPAAVVALVARAQRLLTTGVQHAVPSATGSRRADSATWVHGRLGRPCRRCGAVIRLAQVGPPTRERLLSYCPGCQGGLAPGDSGGPVAPLGSAPRGRRPYRR